MPDENLNPHRVASRRVFLERLEVRADIGFHDHEVGTPQRLLISVEIWLDESTEPGVDEAHAAWNYDFIRDEVIRIAGARRYNLQETLVREIFDRLGAVTGVEALRVCSTKPDIYADSDGVGVEYSSR